MRQYRPVIAFNEQTGERREFASTYIFAKEIGVQQGSVVNTIRTGGSIKGWKLYDTPDNIRKRIAELEAQIKMLEE